MQVNTDGAIATRTITMPEVQAAVQRFRETPSAVTFETLRMLRRDLSRLAAQHPGLREFWPGALRPMYEALKLLGLREMGRNAGEEEFLRELGGIWAAGWSHPSAVQAAIAGMFIAYAYELPLPATVSGAPDWLRADIASYLLEMPQFFAWEGEADRYIAWKEEMLAVFHRETAQPSDVGRELALLFLQHANFIQSYFSERNLRELYRMRGDIISRSLAWSGSQTLFALPPREAPLERIRVGIFAHHLGPQPETFFTLANLDCIDQSRFEVIVYTTRLTGHPLEKRFAAVTDRIVTLPRTPLAAQLKLIRDDDLDLLLIGTNTTAVTNNAALLAAHRLARIQIATESSPVTTGSRQVDVLLTTEWNDPSEDAPGHYTEVLHRMPGSNNVYAYQYETERSTIHMTRQMLDIAQDQVVFFSGANYFKILPELSAAWARILSQVPDSVLVMMPFNPNWKSSYLSVPFLSRIQSQFRAAGVDPARLKIVQAVPARADVQKVVALADVYLDSFPFVGACSLIDSLQAGVPPVVYQGRTARSSHAASLMRQVGLLDVVTRSVEEYEALAVRMGRSAGLRASMAAKLKAAMNCGVPPFMDCASLSKRVEAALGELHQRYRAFHENLARLDADALAERVSALIDEQEEFDPGLRSFTDVAIVQCLLAPFFQAQAPGRGRGCMIDVGACFGQMAAPFLAQGWEVHLFEPDPDSRAILERNMSSFGASARISSAAVANERASTIRFHKTRNRGLSGISPSPHDQTAEVLDVPCVRLTDYCRQNGLHRVDLLKIDAEGHDFEVLASLDLDQFTPRVIMLEFGTVFAGQSIEDLNRTMEEMRKCGYRSLVFTYDDTGNFARGIWSYRLISLALDRPVGIPVDGQFGNLLLFRADDKPFMLALYALLDCARRRRAFLTCE